MVWLIITIITGAIVAVDVFNSIKTDLKKYIDNDKQRDNKK